MGFAGGTPICNLHFLGGVRWFGAMFFWYGVLVRWFGAMLIWYSTVFWCDSLVRCCFGSRVLWCGGLVRCFFGTVFKFWCGCWVRCCFGTLSGFGGKSGLFCQTVFMDNVFW